MSISRPNRWRTNISTTPTASCSSCRELNGLRLRTECGVLEVTPGEVCVIPRGLKFAVDLLDRTARGYICENYGAYFDLPERGPIGANCFANARDFLYPCAAYEDVEKPCELYVKSGGKLYKTEIGQSPLDVVAWHGNFAPCKYDLRRFAPVGATLFDHPDPSIYTVLTSASDRPGTANVDFVIFPERWLVMEEFVPSALVPHECHERVHGPDLRRL